MSEQGSVKRRGMIRVKDPEKTVKVDPKALVEGMLRDMANRLIATENIVLLLAKFDPKGELIFPFGQLQNVAREYVAKEMLSVAGIKRLVKRWEANSHGSR